jgi:phospholipase C
MKRLAAIAAAFACGIAASPALAAPTAHAAAPFVGIHKIRHIVVIMQENRSFDSYFGTYPGADGYPRVHGKITVCVPDPTAGTCQRPYHDTANRNFGGPHDHLDAVDDIAGGAMNGFIKRAEAGRTMFCHRHINSPHCSLSPTAPDVMGYHNAKEIPNYWAYARHFVLQDHMFQPDTSWSLPSHLFLVSGWSARCSQATVPASCVNAIQDPGSPPGEPQNRSGAVPHYAWTDLTYLLHKQHVSWRYYVAAGSQPDCADNAMFCAPCRRRPARPKSGTRCRGSTRCGRTSSCMTCATHELHADARDSTLPRFRGSPPAGRRRPSACASAGQAYDRPRQHDLRSLSWS